MHIEIYRADNSQRLPLTYAFEGIHAGFPTPSEDYISESIDLNKDLIKHPASTFYGKVKGDSMIEEGIDEGDILVIDKSIDPEHGDLAVCCIDGEFTLKRIEIINDSIYLMPSNKNYSPIKITPNNEFMVWGIVVYTIKANRRKRKK